MLKIFIVVILMISLLSCKKEKIEGIVIGNTLYTHQSLFENRAMESLISKSLKKDGVAIVGLKNFPNGGAASLYDLGYVMTQVIYRIGEDDFVCILSEMSKSEVVGFEDLVRAGLEYGDNNYDGKADNLQIEFEFPRLTEVFSQ